MRGPATRVGRACGPDRLFVAWLVCCHLSWRAGSAAFFSTLADSCLTILFGWCCMLRRFSCPSQPQQTPQCATACQPCCHTTTAAAAVPHHPGEQEAQAAGSSTAGRCTSSGRGPAAAAPTCCSRPWASTAALAAVATRAAARDLVGTCTAPHPAAATAHRCPGADTREAATAAAASAGCWMGLLATSAWGPRRVQSSTRAACARSCTLQVPVVSRGCCHHPCWGPVGGSQGGPLTAR